jgi:hypothetical protein
VKRYQTHRFRPATRRTHARPTGRSAASKSAGPGSSFAAASSRTVRPTAIPRSEPGLIANPRRREYQVVTRARRATIRHRSLRAIAKMLPMRRPKEAHRVPPRRLHPGGRLDRPGGAARDGERRLVRGSSSRNKPSADRFGRPIKAAAVVGVGVARSWHALPFGRSHGDLLKTSRRLFREANKSIGRAVYCQTSGSQPRDLSLASTQLARATAPPARAARCRSRPAPC